MDNINFKYIIIIIVILFFNHCRQIKIKEKYQNFTYEDIMFDPQLAGGMDIVHPDFNKSELNSELLQYQIKTSRLRPIESSIPKSSDNSDSYPYEVILSKEFQVPKARKIVLRPIYAMDSSPDTSLLHNETKIDLKDADKIRVNDDDCRGEFSNWDSEHCSDDYPCSLKSKTFQVVKPSVKEGKPCMYKNKIIKDGDVVYDYCKVGSNQDRCGLSKNYCKCKPERNMECIPEEMSFKKCHCPTGTEYEGGKLRKKGKCTKISGYYGGIGLESLSGVYKYINEQMITSLLINYPEKIEKELRKKRN